MALPTFAVRSDLEAHGCAANPREATAVLELVSTAIRAVTGKSFVDDEGALVELSAYAADLLRTVTVEASLRRLRNPDGATQQSEALGPFSQATTIEASNVYFNRTERDMLAQAADDTYPSTSAYPGLGVIGIARGDIETAPLLDDSYPNPDEWAGR